MSFFDLKSLESYLPSAATLSSETDTPCPEIVCPQKSTEEAENVHLDSLT